MAELPIPVTDTDARLYNIATGASYDEIPSPVTVTDVYLDAIAERINNLPPPGGGNDSGIIEKVKLDSATLGAFRSFETEKPYQVVDMLSFPASITGTIPNSKEYEIKWKDSISSLKLSAPAGVPYIANTFSPKITLEGISEFNILVYVPDKSKISQIELRMYKAELGTWTRSAPIEKNGWNLLRFYAYQASFTEWREFLSFRLYLYTSAPTDIYIGRFNAIVPNKARMIFVNDHGYSGFKNIAYPRLKAAGIPVTWGINPGRLGATVATGIKILSLAEIEELSLDPMSEFSFHSFDPTGGGATASMTPLQLQTDTQKCISFLKKNGLTPKHLWRSAFVQNLATNHTAIQDMVEVYASPNGSSSFEVFPFRNVQNVARQAVHARTNAWFDDAFNTMKKTRSLSIFYTHDVNDIGDIHMTNAQFNYFMTKVEQGMAEGWLEGTTYSRLRTQYDKQFGGAGFDSWFDTL